MKDFYVVIQQFNNFLGILSCWMCSCFNRAGKQNSWKAYNKLKANVGVRADARVRCKQKNIVYVKEPQKCSRCFISQSPQHEATAKTCVSALCWEHTHTLSLRHKCWWGHLSWIIPPVHSGTQPNTLTVSENTSTISGRRPHWALQRGVNYRLWGGVAVYAKDLRRMDNRITEANRLLFSTRCNEMQHKRWEQEKAEEWNRRVCMKEVNVFGFFPVSWNSSTLFSTTTHRPGGNLQRHICCCCIPSERTRQRNIFYRKWKIYLTVAQW